MRQDVEDFNDIAEARRSLVSRGFVSVSVNDECYRLSDRDAETGLCQMADVFTPHNQGIGRVSYWVSVGALSRPETPRPRRWPARP